MIYTTLVSSTIILALLLINSLGLFTFLRKRSALFLQFLLLNNRKNQDEVQKGASLKLEAQKISEFSGEYDHWPKWKSRTECAFNGSGYEKILTDNTYAKKNTMMNAIVYSQLAVATVDGNAHHLVKAFEESKDGNKAWMALNDWYNGDVIKNETAEALIEKLENLSLHPGVSASDYVNKYMMRYQELEKIPGEGMSASHARYLFLRNIHDNRYEMTVKYLRNAGADLQECVTAIRKEERDQMRKRVVKRLLRNTIHRLSGGNNTKGDYSDDEYNQKQTNHHKRIRRLSGTIETTKNGFLSIPNDQWATLDDDDKAFVQKYNMKVKHKEPLDKVKIPTGVVINKVRQKNECDTTGETEIEEDDNPSPIKKPCTGKKNIRFNLQNDGKEADEKLEGAWNSDFGLPEIIDETNNIFETKLVDWSKVENGNDKNHHRVYEEIDPVHDNKKMNTNILIIDTGGGTTSTITKQVCMVLITTNHVTSLSGYQNKATPKQYPIVHCAVKAHIQNYDNPVVFLLNYVTLLDDANENKSLFQAFAWI
jgi:hypothetical protein